MPAIPESGVCSVFAMLGSDCKDGCACVGCGDGLTDGAFTAGAVSVGIDSDALGCSIGAAGAGEGCFGASGTFAGCGDGACAGDGSTLAG